MFVDIGTRTKQDQQEDIRKYRKTTGFQHRKKLANTK